MENVPLLVLLFEFISFTRATYDRKLVHQYYPGFGDDYIILEDDDGTDVYGYYKTFHHGRTLFDGLTYKNVEDNVYFIYYNRTVPEGIKINNFTDLPTDFDAKKKTKFIAHGWLSGSDSDLCVQIRDAYLNTSDVNVFILDWHAITGHVLYIIPLTSTPAVASYVAQFLDFLVDKTGIDLKDVHLIGHSLGAQVSGFTGRRVTKGRIGRITALDPALPGFKPIFGDDIGRIQEPHLNANDSEFVDVIHTCAGFLGMKDPIGHVDFYPNGGAPPQPGCTVLQLIEACSHGRSWKLFAESIVHENAYTASECLNNQNFDQHLCVGREIAMGEFAPRDARGIYYLKTSGTAPYFLNFDNFSTIVPIPTDIDDVSSKN